MSNKRGRADRSSDRNTRYATHIPVLRDCIKALQATATDPIYVVEHGMGLGSTPFFHAQEHVARITSYEREAEWLSCVTCASGSMQHKIVHLLDENVDQAAEGIDNPGRTVGLVDGFAAQRMRVLEAWMKSGIAYIIEHDADTFTGKDVYGRQFLSERYGYSAHQYSGRDPESAVFVSSKNHLSLTGSLGAL